MSFRSILVAAAGICGLLLVFTAPVAHAQHVITDSEADKLTLDALTATPRPIYRPVMAIRHMHRTGYASHSARVSRVAYVRRTGVRRTRR